MVFDILLLLIVSVPVERTFKALYMEQRASECSGAGAARRATFWSRGRLNYLITGGVECRWVEGWHGRNFRDYFRFSSPEPTSITRVRISEFYRSLGYVPGSETKMLFTHDAKRFSAFMGSSELRHARVVRVVTCGDEIGGSVVRIVYRVRAGIGLRITSTPCGNSIRDEVVRLAQAIRALHDIGNLSSGVVAPF
jgi:hypothetical protein